MEKISLIVLFICFCFCGYARVPTDSAATRPDILCVMPFQFTENGPGFGGSYERRLDHKGLFSFCLPVMVTFNVANTNRIYDYNTGNYNTGKTDPMLYTMPGVKFYPTGSNGRLKYAIGASVVVGTGKQSSYLTDLNGLNTTELVQHHMLVGVMWQNSLNINVDSKMYLGAELGLGGTVINKAADNDESSEVLVQGALKVGYRF